MTQVTSAIKVSQWRGRMTIHQKREKKDHGKKRLIEKVKMAAKKLKREKKNMFYPA